MKLFVRGEQVVARHHDDQEIPEGAYGEGARLIIVPDDYPLERVGDPVPILEMDTRPYKAPALKGPVLALTLKAACGRRIRAVIKDASTQINLAAWAADAADRKAEGGEITEAERINLEVARAARLWVRDMQEHCRALIAAGDADFEDDAKWPPAPDGAAELANSF